MNRIEVLHYAMIFIIIALLITCLRCIIRKKQGRPYWYCFTHLLAALCIFGVLLWGAIYYDNHDRAYLLDEYVWTYSSYYTEDGKEYHIVDSVYDEDTEMYMGYLENEDEKIPITEAFLTAEGILVIDREHEYKQIEEYVYENDNRERAYYIPACDWYIFGNFVVPEPEGFYIGNTYLKPVSYLDPITNDILIIPIFSIGLILTISSLWRVFKAILPRFNKTKLQQYNNLLHCIVRMLIYCSVMIISVCARSFFSSFMLFLFAVVIGWIVIRFFQASEQIDLELEEGSERPLDGYTLKEYLLKSDEKEALKWQMKFLKLISLHYVMWIIISILSCWSLYNL